MNTKHLQRPYKPVFMSEEEIRAELKLMEQNSSLNTNTEIDYDKRSPSTIRRETFRKRHINYLKAHPKINPKHYLSNLRAALRIRP